MDVTLLVSLILCIACTPVIIKALIHVNNSTSVGVILVWAASLGTFIVRLLSM